jgi:potassium/hydrogen antiporter
MTTSIIITISVLLLLAYVFDISSAKTRIPSVILLLALGWLVGQLATFSGLSLPDFTPALPILGTVGLILIVLEGALELELNRSKLPMVGKALIMAVIPLFAISFGLAWCFQYFAEVPLKTGLVNAIPLAIISSAIAIPSARNLSARSSEFVVYESSLSDIAGVLFFNFMVLNDVINSASVLTFFLDLGLLLVITAVATLGLAFLLSRITHHVKFMPIILITVLIYAICKVYHLPGLLFILILGLFIGNLDALKRFRIVQRLHPEILDRESKKFKELVIEFTFLIRTLFFLLFGYLIQTSELLNPETLAWSFGITAAIFAVRFLMLKLLRMQTRPLLFIAPRGLITILLFLSIPLSYSINPMNKSLVIQVVILTALMMMIGMMLTRSRTNPVSDEPA